MTQDIQDTLLIVPEDGWQEGSSEWQLLDSFRGMLERVQQRMARLEEVEKQLHEREEQYHSIFESVTDGILIIELKESRVVEVNPRGCELFGYTRKELLGQVTGLSDDTQTPAVYARNVIKAGGRFQIKVMTTSKDGKSFYPACSCH